ncbi:hypothetical protein L7F22_015053 [Adiantum nelumboides]|nr:hypothetical protein [Adiantum nelumboides]
MSNMTKRLMLQMVPNILCSHECNAFIKYAEELGFSHQGSLGPAKGEAFRDNDRVSLQNSNLAENLWDSGLSKAFENIKVGGKSASGLSSNIRFYRYREGQRFGPHIDQNVYLERGQRTEYTLLVYLNGSGMKSTKSGIKGGKGSSQILQDGETVFYPGHKHESIEVAPLAGMALFHVHGEKCMLHEARVVSKGAKYVLRSDVVFADIHEV